ncbi:oligosaccharide flippase family protein [Vibrio cholerae]|nr:oligosaccharide flippase family protein [Vibrio cholerae]
MKKLKAITLNSLIYIFCDVFAKSIPFLLMPLVASYLSVAEYGSVSIFQTFIEVSIIFLVFGTHQYYRYVYFNKYEKSDTALLSSIIVSIVLLPVFIALSFIIVTSFELDYWYLAIPLSAFFQSLVSLSMCRFQNSEQPILIAKYTILQSAINFFVTWLLLRLGYGVEGRYLAIIISSVLLGVYSMLVFSRLFSKCDFESSIRLSRDAFIFGAKCLPVSISWWLRSGVDRVIVGGLIGSVAVGELAIVNQLSLVLTVFGIALNNSLMPSVFRSTKAKLKRKIFRYISFEISVILIFLLALNEVLPFFIKQVMPVEYFSSLDFLLLSLSCSALHVVYLMISNILLASGNPTLLSFISIFSALAHVVLSYFFVNSFGIVGVFWAGIVSYGVGIISILYKSRGLMF